MFTGYFACKSCKNRPKDTAREGLEPMGCVFRGPDQEGNVLEHH